MDLDLTPTELLSTTRQYASASTPSCTGRAGHAQVSSARSSLGHTMIVKTLGITAEEFTAGTGWDIKPEGACKGEMCVPLDPRIGFDLESTTERLRMALVPDQDSGLLAIGPESLGDRALVTAEAPELRLPDLDGNEFRLSMLRGQKVVIVSWAPY
jgi:hypothetical protein